MKNLNEHKGITLIALIITVVVLLILAIVTINAVNDGGLFIRAEEAAKRHQIEVEKEAIKLALSEWKMKKFDNSANQTFSNYMKARFNSMDGYRCEEVDENTVILTGPSKTQYRIKEDGKIEDVEAGLILSKTTIGILPGQTATIEVTLVGGLEGDITFASSDTSTITVTSEGVVAVAENPVGTEATITVTCSGHTKTCKVYIADQGDFLYNYDSTNKTAKVTGLSNTGLDKIENAVTTLSMPDKVIYNNEEYTITSIENSAFRNDNSGYPNLNLTNLPSGVTSIENSAFSNCTNLALTELPNGVTSIGNSAFSNCTNLALTELPSGVTSIENTAFLQCTNLALTELPNGVTSIGNSAFLQCTNLALTSLPSGVTSIESSAFYNCTNLALTELPSGVTSIEMMTFYGCTNLALTKLPSNLTSIRDYAFSGCTNLALTELPSGVTSIENGTFQDCTNLDLTELPKGLTRIGECAFKNCTSLALTELPSGVTSLGLYAFENCTSITNITLPSSLTTVGSNIFYKCNSTLQNIYVKELESAPEGWNANWASSITQSKIHWAQ